MEVWKYTEAGKHAESHRTELLSASLGDDLGVSAAVVWPLPGTCHGGLTLYNSLYLWFQGAAVLVPTEPNTSKQPGPGALELGVCFHYWSLL